MGIPADAALALVALAIGAVAPAAAVEAQRTAVAEEPGLSPGGPLRIREQFLLGVGFLSLEPIDPVVLEPGRWRLDLVHTVTNTWVGSEVFEDVLDERPRRQPVTLEELQDVDGDGTAVFLADGEVYRTSLTLRTGLGGGFEAEVTVPWVEFDGGFGDSAIEAFHAGVGLEDGHRSAVPREAFTVYLRDTSGNEVFRNVEPSPGLGDVTLALKRLLDLRSPRWTASLQAVAKLATGDERALQSSGSNDFAAQLLLSRAGERSAWHLAIGATRLGEAERFALGEQTVLSALLAYERRLRPATSAIFQLKAAESPFKELAVEDLGDVTFLADFGIKQRVGRDTVLFAALSENIVHYRNSADFGLHFGLTWTR